MGQPPHYYCQRLATNRANSPRQVKQRPGLNLIGFYAGIATVENSQPLPWITGMLL